jgi:hypothetical protein
VLPDEDPATDPVEADDPADDPADDDDDEPPNFDKAPMMCSNFWLIFFWCEANNLALMPNGILMMKNENFI